jgi:general secretion pathway protein A
LTLRAKTHPLTLEETKAYVQQRLRIAGSDGRQIFDGDALNALHKYSNGIPRVVNLLCEHCLVSAFVDQKAVIGEVIVDAVARDFDLGDSVASGAMTVAAPPATPAEKFDVVEALRTLATLADRLRQSETDLSKERKS